MPLNILPKHDFISCGVRLCINVYFILAIPYFCMFRLHLFFFFGIKNEAVMNTPEHKSLHTTLPSTPGKSPKGDFVNSCCFSEMHWQAALYREPVTLPQYCAAVLSYVDFYIFSWWVSLFQFSTRDITAVPFLPDIADLCLKSGLLSSLLVHQLLLPETFPNCHQCPLIRAINTSFINLASLI